MFNDNGLTQISADGLKSWSRCKRQFYYKHVKKLRWPSDIRHFQLGKDVHKLLDYQARGLDCNLLLSTAPSNVRLTWQKLAPHPLVNTTMVASEWAFHVPIPIQDKAPQWITGRIDRVSLLDDQVVIVDWKTGTGIPRNPEIDWQTRLYLFAFLEVAQANGAHAFLPHNLSALKAEHLKFVYVQAKADTHTPIQEVSIPYNTQKHEATRQTLQTQLAAIREEEVFPLPDNQQCPDKFCAYKTICGISQNN